MSTLLSIFVGGLVIWMIRKIVVGLIAGGDKQSLPYPPGPKPQPLVGNLFDFPDKDAAQAYVEWGKKYNSSILFASALGNNVLIVNSYDDAYELFEKRAKLYNDRPTIPIVEVMGWDHIVSLIPYGEDWRFHRKLAWQSFRPEAVRSYEPLQTKIMHTLLRGLLTNPTEFDTHNKMVSISFAMASMYGYEVKSLDDPCIAAADESISLGAVLMVPGKSLINDFLILRHVPPWFPGASSRRTAAKVRMLTDEMRRIPTEFVKKQFSEGIAPPSFFAEFLERKHSTGVTQEEETAVENIAYTTYGAGADTMISTTGTFLYLMAVNPRVQQKAHEEIDRIVGSKRLPNLNDRDSLPYLEAIYREVLRWRPALLMSVPHALSEDDYYKGYFIPKGTTVLPNIWAMTRDEKVYPDAHSFKPERFFDADGKLNDDDKILSYGFGRRVCLGKHLASTTVWLMIASVLACFDIRKARDEDGNEIAIADDYEDCGIINHKKKFECSFDVLSPAHVKLIMEEHD